MITKTRFKKLCAIVLSLCIIVSIFSNIVIPIYAAGDEYTVTTITADSEGINLNSLGTLSSHPFNADMQEELDWSTYGYDTNNCWVNGAWNYASSWWGTYNLQTAWEGNGVEFSANASSGTAQYTFYAMSYTFTGEGTLSYSYDINSLRYDRESYPTYSYAEGLVFIADDVVAFMEDGATNGSYTYKFENDGEHTVTWIFNYYLTGYNRSAKISNISLKLAGKPEGFEPVAQIATADGATVYCDTLQGAVDIVENNETITLLKNTTENITSTDGKSYTLDLGTHTIDGGGEAANASVYRIKGGTVTLKNGKLTNGYMGGTGASSANRGGALYIDDSSTNVFLEDMTITGNHARDGGGIFIYSGNLTIRDSEISNNSAYTMGGAIKVYIASTAVTLNNVDFIGNSAGYDNAAAISTDGELTADDCEFKENFTTADGSNTSIIESGGDATFKNCKFVDNNGGMHTILASGTLEFDGCEISGNTAEETGGILLDNGGIITLKNTVVKDNEATGSESDVSRDVYPSGGILLARGTLKFESGAIYNNISGSDANDLYIRGYSSSYVDIIAPSTMEDDGKNFDDYVWRQPDGSFLGEQLTGLQSQSTPLMLTAYENSERPIAEYKGVKYNSLKLAVDEAAKDSDGSQPAVITLIAGEDDDEDVAFDGKIFSSEKVEINIPVEIDFNGRTVLTNQILVKDGVLFNVTGENGLLKFSGEGTVNGGIKLDNGKPLEVSDDFNCSGMISIILNEKNANNLNTYNPDDEDIVVPIINGNGAGSKLESLDIGLTNIINPHVTIKAEGDDSIVAVNPVINGVFVSRNGNDSASGTYSDPVKSINQAILKLESDESTIYLLDTITVSSSDTWSSGNRDTVTVKRFSTKTDQSGAQMVNVTGGTFTLENITIDGGSELYTKCGSIINVGNNATLNIKDGATLKNNDVSTTGINLDSRTGGAVYSAGTIKMTGGKITKCKALLGGGIYCDRTGAQFYMSGGMITDNRAEGNYNLYYGSGGGVTMTSGAQMTMSGGTISDNSASYGGGISLGTGETSFVVSSQKDVYQLKMSGGTLSGNSAGNGGGVFVQSSYKAEITGGYFTKNIARGGNFGGGALYVNGGKSGVVDGEAHIRSVLIKNNHADTSGGAIAGCNTSHTVVNITEGSVIYNNTSGTDTSRDDDILISTSSIMDAFGSSKEGGADHISKFMLDGTPYQWKHVGAGRYAAEDDLNDSGGKHVYTDVTPGIEDDDSQIKVRMIDNESRTRGGAIGSNGTVIIGGEYVDPDKFSVKKVWENLDGDLDRPTSLEQLNIWILGFKDNENTASYISYNQLQDNSGWRDVVSFENLSDEYEYVLLEEVILSNGKHIWSANGKDYEAAIKSIMDVNYHDTEFIFSDNASSPFSSALTGPTSENDGDEFTFTNTYSAVPTTYAPQIIKTITGDTPTSNKTFTFNITANANNPSGATLPTSTSATLTGAGSTRFGNITFSKAGTYSFEIKETKGSDSGYTYDESVWTLTVVVADDNSQLKVSSATYFKNGTEVKGAEAAEFANSYSTTEVSYAPQIEKTVTGDTPSDETFNFNITASEDNPNGATLPADTTATVTGSGSTSFGNISFTKAGTYSFEIKETQGDVLGYSYDGSVWTLTVVVEDIDSILTIASHTYTKVDGTSSDNEASFENIYSSGSLTISKTVTGDAGDKDKEFTFTVTLTDDNGNPLNGEYRYTGSKEGTIKSGEAIKLKHGESVTISGLPVGAKYTVTEEEANKDGYATMIKGDSGAITDGAELVAEFTNEKNTTPVPTKPTSSTEPTTKKPKGKTTKKSTTSKTNKISPTTMTNNTGNSGNTPDTGNEDNKSLPLAFFVIFVLGIGTVYISFRRVKLKGSKTK